MDVIEIKTKMDEMPLVKKMTRERQMEGKKVDKNAIQNEIREMQQQKCDWAFKSVERDARMQHNPQRRIDAFSSKTNSPMPGKYNPRYA
jgi:hypothetical protein